MLVLRHLRMPVPLAFVLTFVLWLIAGGLLHSLPAAVAGDEPPLAPPTVASPLAQGQHFNIEVKVGAPPTPTSPSPDRPPSPSPVDPVLLTIKHKFEQTFPNTPVTSFERAPIEGLFRVQSKGTTFFVDAPLHWLFVGDIYSLTTPPGGQATSKTLAPSDQGTPSGPSAAVISPPAPSVPLLTWEKLPLDLAVVYNPGKSRALAVWDDPDCPFCRKFHATILPELLKEDLTVYVFLYPLTALHPKAYDKSVAIWCSQHRTDALEATMQDQTVTAEPCTHPIDRIIALAGQLGVRGTPTIVLDNNQIVMGAQPVSTITAKLSSAPPVTTTAAPRPASTDQPHGQNTGLSPLVSPPPPLAQ